MTPPDGRPDETDDERSVRILQEQRADDESPVRSHSDLIVAIVLMLAIAAALTCTGCATIEDPPLPQGSLTYRQVHEWRNAMTDAARRRDIRSARITRSLNLLCTAADVATTLVAVNLDSKELKEANPLLPNPARHPGYFLGVKIAIGGANDYVARQGYHNEVRVSSGVLCGIALWNLTRILR